MPVQDLRLHTSVPLTDVQIGQLADRGLRVVSRLSANSYRVRGESTTTAADLVALDFVDTASAYDPMDKLDPSLIAASTVVRAAVAGGQAAPLVNVLASLDPDTDADATAAELAELGDVVEKTSRRVLLRVPTDRLAEVAAVDGVLRAEIEPDPHIQNNVARVLTKVEPVAVNLGLDGSGEIVGVADSGLDTGVPATVLADFAGRVVNIRATVVKAPANGADLNNHGTHVSGSILGDGANSNGTLRGMAPAARLTMLSMGPNNSSGLSVPADLVTGVFTDAYNDGARIHSNSWGSNNNLGKYTAFSEDVDDFVFNHPDMLVVIAAGNSGSAGSTVSAPGTAKNCLTVGAAESVRPLPGSISITPNLQDADHNPATAKTSVPLTLNSFSLQADNYDDIASFSGRGPLNDTGDTRLKPDIVAPGTFILSCRSTVSTADVGPDGLAHSAQIDGFYADDADDVATHAEAVGRGLPGAPFFGTWNQNTPAAPAGSGPLAQQNYFYDSGTSMATPVTAGSMALLRQHLRQHRGIANPSAALMKAMVVNAATVPATASAAPDNNRGFGWLNLEQLLTPPPTGQQAFSDDTQLAVATGDVRQLAVQVADPSLPLRVTLVWTDRPGKGLQNRLYLRLVPPGAGAAIDGDVTAFPNPTNNVQRVHVAAPAAGTWTIEVHGIDVPFGIPALAPALRQDFALAISNGIGFSPKPVDLTQVIDHSGSMGFYSFMVPARERSKQLVDVLRVNDRTGVVMFDGSAATVQPVVPILSAATQAAIKAAVDTIVPAGVTSIGAGLQQGLADLAAGGDPSHPVAIVLVSDGHENTPPWVGGGVTDSPPSWYSGPDLTEILPAVPATAKIYTVSLGVASDEVLLQEVAAARGGLFQSIHSAAEIGKLHEIYVHLQALVGGEEVIAAGSDTVEGLGGAHALGATRSALGRAPQDLPELEGLLDPTSAQGQAAVGAASPLKIHTVPLDDTMTSATFIVSWHDTGRPVQMSLVSPSLAVFTPTSAPGLTTTGSSYVVMRLASPEPGLWQLRVSAGDTKGQAGYTWGVHGETPFGLRLMPPTKPLGQRQHEVLVKLDDPSGLAQKARFAGRASTPAVSVDDLVAKNLEALKRIRLRSKPDTPALDPNVAKLAILDLQLTATGKPSLFESHVQKLRFAGRGTKKATFESVTAGTSGVEVRVSGTTSGGYPFARVARCDVHS